MAKRDCFVRPGDPSDRFGIVLEGVFRAFEQVDTSLTREHGGTGLGLYICSRVAEAMGGTIGVDSQPGQGSAFWFTVRLPLAPLA